MGPGSRPDRATRRASADGSDGSCEALRYLVKRGLFELLDLCTALFAAATRSQGAAVRRPTAPLPSGSAALREACSGRCTGLRRDHGSPHNSVSRTRWSRSLHACRFASALLRRHAQIANPADTSAAPVEIHACTPGPTARVGCVSASPSQGCRQLRQQPECAPSTHALRIPARMTRVTRMVSQNGA